MSSIANALNATAATNTNATSSSSGGGAGNGFASLDSQKFLKIILSELQHQDPLKPNDTNAMVQELSSVRNIESQSQLQDSLTALVSQNAISSGSRFIGSYVKGQDAQGHSVEGVVGSLRVQNGKPVLMLQDGTALPAERVTNVEKPGASSGQALQALVGDVQLLGSSAIIGKQISGANTDGQQVSGQVTAIRSDAAHGLMAELDTGQTLAVSSIQRVTGEADHGTSAAAAS